jgi:antitoxin (DNA-binding transcriptional repressor) of toxin-antitoxin stability system
MRSVELKNLKDKLSEYGRHAASNERVFITDRDRIVAELVPPREGLSPYFPMLYWLRRFAKAG